MSRFFDPIIVRQSRAAGLSLLIFLVGCTPPPVRYNQLQIGTELSHYSYNNLTINVPLGGQPVEGDWLYDAPGGNIQGTIKTFSGITPPYFNGSTSPFFGYLPTTVYSPSGVELPATWAFSWVPTNVACTSVIPPYPILTGIQTVNEDVSPTYSILAGGPLTVQGVNFQCYTNTPLTPYFIPSHVSPQFVLDDAFPASITVAALTQITAPSQITTLNSFSTSLANISTMTATSIAANGMSATFPYPTDVNGNSLVAGAYIATITSQPGDGSQTTSGMEPFYIGHDDKSWNGAYGLSVAFPTETDVVTSGVASRSGVCSHLSTSTTTYGGTPVPLVTEITQNKLAIGSGSNTVNVGVSPTVVLPFNSNRKL